MRRAAERVLVFFVTHQRLAYCTWGTISLPHSRTRTHSQVSAATSENSYCREQDIMTISAILLLSGSCLCYFSSSSSSLAGRPLREASRRIQKRPRL